jgi:hypothetical protein
MEYAQLDSKEWSRIVARLGGEEALASSARECGAFVRARGVKSAVDVLRLALLYGPGGHSLRSVAAMAAAVGLADVSDVAILDRLKRAADWLQGLCKERLAWVAKEIGVKTPERPIRTAVGWKGPAIESGGFICATTRALHALSMLSLRPPRTASGLIGSP